MTKTIAYITDIHLDEQFPIDNGVDTRSNWKLLLGDVASKNIDEIIFGGDIGEISANEWFFDSLKEFTLNLTLGNHDQFAEASKHFKSKHLNGYDELYYSFEDEYLKYVFLDTSSNSLSPSQFEWLRSELETQKKVLLFLHHPVLAVETPIDNYYPLNGREKIAELLQEHNNEITIFCGHYHAADERTDGKIRQIMTPATSYQVKKYHDASDIPGFTRAYITPDGGITWNTTNDNLHESKLGDNTIITNANTFGYRIIMIEDGKIDTKLLLYKDGKFVIATAHEF
jgi:Icc protein